MKHEYLKDKLKNDFISMSQGLQKMSEEKIELERKNKKLIEALKFECGNRCSDLNPCNAKEVLREVDI